jgi:hypothetical protein
MATRLLFILALLAPLSAGHAADQKDRRPVDPAGLASLVMTADKIVVSEGPYEGAKVLFTSTSGEDIAELNQALAVVRTKNAFHCGCLGTPCVRLYRQGTEIARITSRMRRTGTG